jgi:predicted MFS family arabinose efflux permease
MFQLGDTMQYLSTIIISLFGWRNTWKLCGGSGMLVGILTCIFVKEPTRVVEETEEEDLQLET